MVVTKEAIKKFIKRWQAAEGNEDREARSFWIELYQDVLGVEHPTQVLDFERRVRGRKIDVFYEDQGVLIENKSRGIGLDDFEQRGFVTIKGQKMPRMVTPYEQAKWYADELPYSVRPRWIVTCNFDEIRIYNQDDTDPQASYVSVRLDELADQTQLLSFLVDKRVSRIEREKDLSVQAGTIVGRLYKALASRYHNIETDEREQKSLNVLVTRIVFLLYAEDAGLLQEVDAFYKYFDGIPAGKMRGALIDLFRVLDTPKADRDPYMEDDVLAFPYVNGGRFHDADVIVPQFDDEAREILLKEASAGFNWSKISPTIFGAVFESTLNPETRRAGGMHYTSVENIHKVIDPLFLDGIKADLVKAESADTLAGRERELLALKRRLGTPRFLDPACGSGNFLTETYTSLRRIENRIMLDLQGEQSVLPVEGDESTTIGVTIDQFYGIEVNDFAVSVAKTALWIAEEQMMRETQDIVPQQLSFLPLTNQTGIREGNALRMDWNDVLPADQCSYIMGNPPFLGSSVRSKEQAEDMDIAFAGRSKYGKIDYCGAWYQKAATYIDDTDVRCAFVSTNSICQGEQVEPMWKWLFDHGYSIDFAWRTFVWDSEATDKAHVHVVIVGFHHGMGFEKKLYHISGAATLVENINGYLTDAPNVFIPSRGRAIDALHKDMVQGCKPVDGGNLIIKPEDYDRFIRDNPTVAGYIRPYLGSSEFLNGKKRWCLWLREANPRDISASSETMNRLRAVRQVRLESPTKEFREYADKPMLFVQDRHCESIQLLIPSVSSGRRVYAPIGYGPGNVIISNLAYVIPDASLYEFGILSSLMHNAWMRVVCGRLKSDYRYNPSVYNSFAYPDSTDKQRTEIEHCAQAVLDARAEYPDSTLADMYDPDNDFLYPALMKAHRELDAAVEAAYGVDFGGDEEKIVAHLFKLYAEKTS